TWLLRCPTSGGLAQRPHRLGLRLARKEVVRAAAELSLPPPRPPPPPAAAPPGERGAPLVAPPAGGVLPDPSGGGGGSEKGPSRAECTDRRPWASSGFSPRCPSSVRTLRLEALLRLAARFRFSTSLSRL
ncbi:unnamed protein product, partial [Ixodes pacificus]